MLLPVTSDRIIIRYSELALKAKETRKHFERILLKNIAYALSTQQITHCIDREWGRIYVSTPKINESIPVLQHVYGITSVSPALETISTIPDIALACQQIIHNRPTSDHSFAVRATRTGSHEFSSQDVAVIIGELIRKKTKARVDLTNPDITIGIDIREEKTYVFIDTFDGVGGLPLGTQGAIGVLISSATSLLATWFLMKRGCTPVFFVPPEVSKQIVLKFLTTWYADAPVIELQAVDENILSQLMQEHGCDAFVMDTRLQSEKDLIVVQQMKSRLDIPVFTPLLAWSSEDICKHLQLILVQT